MKPARSPREPREAAIDSELRRKEQEWVARACAAEATAYRALYDLAFRLIWAWSLRTTGSPARAEQLTAATLRRAFASLDLGLQGASLGTWLLRHAAAVLEELDAPARVAIGEAAPAAPHRVGGST